MLEIYEGPMGTGKTLHAVKRIVSALKRGKHVITNIKIDQDMIADMPGIYVYRGYDQLNPIEFVHYSLENNPESEEQKFLVVIDEANVILNSRDFMKADRKLWLKFVPHSRHLGYDVILISQSIKDIDKQIREKATFTTIHKCMNNMKYLDVLLPFKWFWGIEKIISGSTLTYNGMTPFLIGSAGKYYDTHQTKDEIFIVFPEAKI